MVRNSFGIDFGTTNSSLVCCFSGDGAVTWECIGDEAGRPTPSMVAIHRETGEIFTGREAWNKRSELARSCECVKSVKSLLEVDGWKRDIAGRSWTAVDIASEVFRSLKSRIDIKSEGVQKATVAVPVGFSRKKRELVRKAALEAGFDIEGFVSEPTAAFFANYEELKGDEVVVVFDWGGGTLDVSVMRNRNGRIYELATEGMPVAGDDIDERLARKVHSKIARSKELSVSFEEMSASDRDLLLVRSEKAKIELSDSEESSIRMSKYGELGLVRELVSYEWFEASIESIVDEAVSCLDRAIANSGETPASVDRILMVGGSSNIGPLLDKLDARFGDKLFFPEDTVWSISKGAARLSATPGKYCSAQKVGIILSDGSYFPLLEPGDAVSGWSKECEFALTDTSKEMRVVFSGSKDIDDREDKRQIVEIPSYRFLEEKLKIRAFVDRDSVFRVSMKSSMRRSEDTRVWEYDRLKLYYSLEDCGF